MRGPLIKPVSGGQLFGQELGDRRFVVEITGRPHLFNDLAGDLRSPHGNAQGRFSRTAGNGNPAHEFANRARLAVRHHESHPVRVLHGRQRGDDRIDRVVNVEGVDHRQTRAQQRQPALGSAVDDPFGQLRFTWAPHEVGAQGEHPELIVRCGKGQAFAGGLCAGVLAAGGLGIGRTRTVADKGITRVGNRR